MNILECNTRCITQIIEALKYNHEHTLSGEFGVTGRTGGGAGGSVLPAKATAAQIRAAKVAEQHLRAMYPTVGFSFKKVHASLVPELAQTFDGLMQAYPETAKTIDFFGSFDKNAGPAAFHLYGDTFPAKMVDTAPALFATLKGPAGVTQSIVLNQKFFGDPEFLLSNLQKGADRGWYPAGVPPTAEMVVTHEFGHAVNMVALQPERGAAATVLANITDKTNPEILGQVSRYTKATFAKRGNQMGKVEWFAESFSQMRLAPEQLWSLPTKMLHGWRNQIQLKEDTASLQSDSILQWAQEKQWLEPDGYPLFSRKDEKYAR